MKRIAIVSAWSLFAIVAHAQEVTSACGTSIKDLSAATIEELGAEYRRLDSYHNPYCDTTDSDYHKLMKELAKKLKVSAADADAVVTQMGEPYFRGTLAEYEGQKVTIGRNGQPIGKSLPPQFKIPAGDYYVVYLWRKKDYLVFAFKADKCAGFSWWEKGNYK